MCRHSFFVLRSPVVHTISDVSDVSFSGDETAYLSISSVKNLDMANSKTNIRRAPEALLRHCFVDSVCRFPDLQKFGRDGFQ